MSSITKQWFRDTGLRCWISTIFLIFTSSMCTGYFFWWYSNPKSTSHTFPITGKAMYYDVLYIFVYYLGIHRNIGEPACIILIPTGLDLVLKNFCFNNVFFLFCNNELIFKLICSTSLLFKLSLNMNIHFSDSYWYIKNNINTDINMVIISIFSNMVISLTLAWSL